MAYITDNRVDHWGVGFYHKDGRFGGFASRLSHCIDEQDAHTVAERYRNHYEGEDWRAVPLNRQGYIVAKEVRS